MVAYSFKKIFAPQIEARQKHQTVRADRRRHARPDEAVQLFEGMRTRHCRKLLAIDPICVAVLPILIETTPRGITMIELDGCKLGGDDAEAFAIDDGFAPDRIGLLCADLDSKNALGNMAIFWCQNNKLGLFSGVTIIWDPVSRPLLTEPDSI